MENKRPIVILGAGGLLGYELKREYWDLDPYPLRRIELDITDFEAVDRLMKHLNAGLIVNAAAYTDVDGAEENQELANEINGYAAGNLAETAKRINATLVHFSTDYVFSGEKEEGYKEIDIPQNPVNAYGKSKLLGEKLIQRSHDKFYIIRLSGLFGKNGKDFVDAILKLGSKREELKVVNDQYLRPTYAVDLARKTKELIDNKSAFGIYHLTNENTTTWYEFANTIFKTQKKLIDEGAPKINPCSSEEFLLPAKRPRYSVLLNTKFSSLRSWQEALENYFSVLYHSCPVSSTG
jgi:dTDP-4-dehydrorhamnose reductase